MSVPLAVGHKGALVNAFRGAQGVFLMTPPIAPPETHEMELGKQQADAAMEAGVQHVIFSALENVEKITGGKKWAPHFTDKARVEEYIRGLPVTSSFVHLAFFYTNLIEYYSPRMDGDTLVFPIYLPEHFRAPFTDPLTATGPAVLEIFDNPDKYAASLCRLSATSSRLTRSSRLSGASPGEKSLIARRSRAKDYWIAFRRLRPIRGSCAKFWGWQNTRWSMVTTAKTAI